jgi:hypothetical protein
MPVVTTKPEGHMGYWNLRADWPYTRATDWCQQCRMKPMMLPMLEKEPEDSMEHELEESFDDKVKRAMAATDKNRKLL